MTPATAARAAGRSRPAALVARARARLAAGTRPGVLRAAASGRQSSGRTWARSVSGSRAQLVTTTSWQVAEHVRRLADGDAHRGGGEQRLVRRAVAAGDRALAAARPACRRRSAEHPPCRRRERRRRGSPGRMGSTRSRPAHSARSSAKSRATTAGSPWRTSRLTWSPGSRSAARSAVRGRLATAGRVAPAGLELARLVHVPDRHGHARGQGLGGDGARLRPGQRQVPQDPAGCLHDERAVVAGEDDGLHAQRGRRPAARPAAAARCRRRRARRRRSAQRAPLRRRAPGAAS